MDSKLIQTAPAYAERILLANGGELELLGSNQAYQQVWVRAGMLCGLGLWLTRNKDGRAIHARSLATLRHFQSPLSKIPHNVGMKVVSDLALIAHGRNLGDTLEESVAIEDNIHTSSVDVWMATSGTSLPGPGFFHAIWLSI
jgi:hypothetical protein